MILLLALSHWVFAVAPVLRTPELHLLTMGPGSHVYMAGGHAALLVVRYEKDGRPRTQMYNYGEADFDSPNFAYDYVRGRARFYLSSPGDLDWTVQKYGVREGRFVYRQKVNFTPPQVAAAIQRLEWESRPENREYVQHLLEANCATRIRDFLNDLTDGEIRRQLAFQPNEHTVRYYQWVSFWEHPVVGLIADLFFGRRHDQPIDRYFALLDPTQLRRTLPEVRVNGGALLGETITIVEVPGELAAAQAFSPVSVYGSFLVLIFLASAGWAARRTSARGWGVRLYGAGMLGWTLFSSAVGLAYLALFVFSDIPETHANEWFAVFVVTDILLLPTFARMLRSGRGLTVTRNIWWYGAVRLGVLALLLAGHTVEIFYQRPVSLALGAAGVWLTFVMVGMPAHYAERAVKLFAQYHPRQFVRKRLRT